jgi:hypothetical protein
MADHYFSDWDIHPRDNQTTIYICGCGFQTSDRRRLDAHIRVEKADLW